MRQTPYRVGISGSYGGLNLGDEAILHALIEQMRSRLNVEICVFSKNPADTLHRHPVSRAVPVRELSRTEAQREVAKLDLLIFGGGGILFDQEVEVYLREVMLAHELGVPVMVYAVSAGPLVHRSSRKMVLDALQPAAVVTVRDRQAQRLLEDLGLRRQVLLTADPALLLEPEPLPGDALALEGLATGRRVVGFSVREPGPAAPEINVDHYHSLLANAADFIIERIDADILFVTMERDRNDTQHSHAVVSQMQNASRAHVLRGEYSPGQLLSLIGHLEFAVGMRLHFLLFAALQGVPFVALPYSSKVSGLLVELGLDTPPLDDVNSGQLLAMIDRCWDWRHQLRVQIQDRLPALKARARETNELLVQLLLGLPEKARQPEEV